MRSFGDASPCGTASEVLVGLVNRTEARPTARTPTRSSVSMRKAHFMDKHPIRSPHRHAGMALRYLWKGSPCQTRSQTRP